MKHTVTDVEVAGAVRQVRLDRAGDQAAILGMDSLKPCFLRAADLVRVAPDEGDPTGGKMNAVGNEIPVPQSLILRPVWIHGLPTLGSITFETTRPPSKKRLGSTTA
jgi:hypothetical protein